MEEDKRVFVSYDGALYFSALEHIDRGNYSCNVQSKVSDKGRNGPFFPLRVQPYRKFCRYLRVLMEATSSVVVILYIKSINYHACY